MAWVPADPPPGSPWPGCGPGVVHVEGEGGLVRHDGGQVDPPQLLYLRLAHDYKIIFRNVPIHIRVE